MTIIDHNDAIELEHIVRKLYKCDRCGVSGLADADNFVSNPMCAAYLVVGYIHAKELQTTETQYDDFLYKYETIFDKPEDNDTEKEIAAYIKDLTNIVNQYV